MYLKTKKPFLSNLNHASSLKLIQFLEIYAFIVAQNLLICIYGKKRSHFIRSQITYAIFDGRSVYLVRFSKNNTPTYRAENV